MKATTDWSFRRTNIGNYTESDFANDWDYFFYLHLNDQTRYLHLAGTLIGLVLLPWATYRFFAYWEILPGLVYTFFYYGVGFLSHYVCDGQVSGSWKQFLTSYRHAVRLNLITLRRTYAEEENRFRALYPETLWLYSKEFAPVRPKAHELCAD